MPRLAVVCLVLFASVACEKPEAPQAPPPVLSELDLLKKAAEGGDVAQQLALAGRYARGDGMQKDQILAMQWFLKAAQSGSAPAMLEVSKRYGSGYGVEKSESEAKSWRRKASEAGDLDAQYDVATENAMIHRGGVFVFDEGLTTEAESEAAANALLDGMSKLAKAGHSKAMHELAWIKTFGISSRRKASNARPLVAPDTSMEGAVALLRAAADKNYWESQWALAVLYQAGFKDIAPDQNESNKWWQSLDSQNDAAVQYDVAFHYEESDKDNYPQGYNKWKGRSLSFEESNKLAADWYERAAAQGHAGAMWRLALMQFNGKGVPRDRSSALANLKRAAAKDHPNALYWLGRGFTTGEDVPKDYAAAMELYSKAVNAEGPYGYNGVRAQAQNAIGVFHEYGYGTPRDLLLAYAWYNLAAAGGYDKAKANLARVEKELKPEELTEAQALTRQWAVGKTIARDGSATVKTAGAVSTSGLKHAGNGTGFFVSLGGDVLTNQHVVGQCAEVRVPALGKVAKLITADAANDLALVRIEGATDVAASFPGADELKQGDEIAVFGFPLDGYLPSSGNFTLGIVSALAGPSNNSSLIQITAPVQPGNSGGPVLDRRGRAVGVVVGKANAIKIAQVTGDITQNVNFAIAGGTVKAFLDGSHIAYKRPGFKLFANAMSSAELADEARRISVKLECWR